VIIAGLISSGLACFGYGIAWSLPMVIALMFVHGPEGFVHPMMTATMSKVVPETAQGELQGGLSGLMNIATLLGQVFFCAGVPLLPDARRAVPVAEFASFISSAGVAETLAMLLWLVPRQSAAARQG